MPLPARRSWSDSVDVFSYIGITDFSTPDQVRMMVDFFKEHANGRLDCRLMVGVMMSYKTLNGLETKWAKVWPPLKNYRDLFISNFDLTWTDLTRLKVYNTLHYADYEGIDIANSLVKAVNICGYDKSLCHRENQTLHAIQLDMVWPDPKALSRFFDTVGTGLDVILQINSKALERVGNDPKKLVETLTKYQFGLRRVLLDKSMGRGLGMDAKALLPFIRAIREDKFTHRLGISVAGGLGPTTLNLVEPILKEFPDVSIDAQGKLRPSGSALDSIDWAFAKKYVKGALKLLPRRDLVV